MTYIQIRYTERELNWHKHSDWFNEHKFPMACYPIMDTTEIGMHFVYGFANETDATAFKLKFGEHCL